MASQLSVALLPAKTQEVPLSDPVCRIGRHTLSELKITSSIDPKKLCVSRDQIELRINGGDIVLRVLGLNPILITRGRDGRVFKIEKGEEIFVVPRDTFTLVGSHFPFELIKNGFLDKAGPKPTSKDEVSNESSLTTAVRSMELVAPSANGKDANVPSTSDPIENGGSDGAPIERKISQAPSPEAVSFVNKKVRVFWKREQNWFYGKVTNYCADTDEFEVTYPDGDAAYEPKSEVVILPEYHTGLPKKKHATKGKEEKLKKRRLSDDGRSAREKRQKKKVNYSEWISTSESEESDARTHVVRKKTPRVRFEMNPTSEQLSGRKTLVLYSEVFLKHLVPKWHLERPQRVEAVMAGLTPLLEKYPDNLVVSGEFSPISKENLLLVHDEYYLDRLEKSAPGTDMPEHVSQYLQSLEDDEMPPDDDDKDTFMSKGSMEAALSAAGAVCKAIDQVMDGTYRNSFCAVRPPGHHCGKKGHTKAARTQGYCILNNVSIGVAYAFKRYQLKKIAVVDFDVHHGNGTEELLSGRTDALFISIHVGDIYPHTGTDEDPHGSNVVNIDLFGGAGSEEFQKAFDDRILPALDKFAPELLVLSSGFDGHKKDPTEGGLKLDEKDYFDITNKLKRIADKHCGGKIVSVLEGGYHLSSLRKSAREHVVALMMK
eukprot:TRINITY_DN7417_c0_g1_i1.p1 TRINITY_DN7417_c0_g1~~TRINITY_DN7417_c0_g1_i1.p1  ORF type:complete len:658 (+),score=156.78 TRINITY_DN7417_c0_g1_i1:79-2052(+)